ncbi:hypothetical protein LSAT2_023817 [Lamellibrachia satsuma]|nr:hypothetical protein LSAT2_023817 [Lamellibrachia satsuma]
MSTRASMPARWSAGGGLDTAELGSTFVASAAEQNIHQLSGCRRPTTTPMLSALPQRRPLAGRSNPPDSHERPGDVTVLPKIVLRDILGRELDTNSGQQKLINAARWRVANGLGARQPEEWRLPHAPLPVRPDYSRTAPGCHQRAQGRCPNRTKPGVLRQRHARKVYLPFVSTLHHGDKSSASTEEKTQLWKRDLGALLSRLQFCYGCERNASPHFHGIRIMRTGGGFTYLQRVCRDGSSDSSGPLFWKVLYHFNEETGEYWRQGECSPGCNPMVCQLPMGTPRRLCETPEGHREILFPPIAAIASRDVTTKHGLVLSGAAQTTVHIATVGDDLPDNWTDPVERGGRRTYKLRRLQRNEERPLSQISNLSVDQIETALLDELLPILTGRHWSRSPGGNRGMNADSPGAHDVLPTIHKMAGRNARSRSHGRIMNSGGRSMDLTIPQCNSAKLQSGHDVFFTRPGAAEENHPQTLESGQDAVFTRSGVVGEFHTQTFESGHDAGLTRPGIVEEILPQTVASDDSSHSFGGSLLGGLRTNSVSTNASELSNQTNSSSHDDVRHDQSQNFPEITEHRTEPDVGSPSSPERNNDQIRRRMTAGANRRQEDGKTNRSRDWLVITADASTSDDNYLQNRRTKATTRPKRTGKHMIRRPNRKKSVQDVAPQEIQNEYCHLESRELTNRGMKPDMKDKVTLTRSSVTPSLKEEAHIASPVTLSSSTFLVKQESDLTSLFTSLLTRSTVTPPPNKDEPPLLPSIAPNVPPPLADYPVKRKLAASVSGVMIRGQGCTRTRRRIWGGGAKSAINLPIKRVEPPHVQDEQVPQEVPPASSGPPLHSMPPSGKNIHSEKPSRTRTQRQATAPISTDELQQVEHPLDYLAKYCIIHPDRLPRYEHVFHKTVTAQKRRYDGQTGASALSEHHRKTIENFVLIDRAMAADVATVSNVEVSGRRTVAHKAE